MGLLILIVSSCVDHRTVSHKRFAEVPKYEIRLLQNDLAVASFYCGSTDQYHYIAIDRKLIWRFHSYVKVRRSELTIEEGMIFPFSSDRRMWVEYSGIFPPERHENYFIERIEAAAKKGLLKEKE